MKYHLFQQGNCVFEDINKLLDNFSNNNDLDLSKHPAKLFADHFNSTDVGRQPVGSGPYVFVNWETDDRIVLQRDINYWGDV